MTLVKICGITNLEDALMAIDEGADMLGFNFFDKSPRHIAPGSARYIIDAINGRMQTVGVFVNEPWEQLFQITVDSFVNVIQFHGNEIPSDLDVIRNSLGLKVIKAIRTSSDTEQIEFEDYGQTAFLLDGCSPGKYGGTGTVADWEIARRIVERGYTVYLAGGLNPENVADAVRRVHPFAVDVASGVERSPGKKDPKKVAAFIKAAKEAL